MTADATCNLVHIEACCQQVDGLTKYSDRIHTYGFLLGLHTKFAEFSVISVNGNGNGKKEKTETKLKLK
jgi:hypothetical protein